MSVIDTNGNCMLIDMDSKEPREDIANFKKTDVWDVVWATVDRNLLLHVFIARCACLIGSAGFVRRHGEDENLVRARHRDGRGSALFGLHMRVQQSASESGHAR